MYEPLLHCAKSMLPLPSPLEHAKAKTSGPLAESVQPGHVYPTTSEIFWLVTAFSFRQYKSPSRVSLQRDRLRTKISIPRNPLKNRPPQGICLKRNLILPRNSSFSFFFCYPWLRLLLSLLHLLFLLPLTLTLLVSPSFFQHNNIKTNYIIVILLSSTVFGGELRFPIIDFEFFL